MSHPRPRLAALLFTPGNRPDRFPKAVAAGADGIIIDWEDSVGPAEKDRVRAEGVDWLKVHGRVAPAPFVTAVRINPVRSETGKQDLAALQASGVRPDLVLLPKVESAMEVQVAANVLPHDTGLLCLIESVRGVRAAAEIASACSHVIGLGFGGLDLSAETGGEPVWDALLFPRTQVVHACAAAGVLAIDQPYIDFKNEAGLVDECVRTRALGFTGKLAIHPAQCGPIRQAYQPAPAQIERARRIVAAYETAQGNVASVDGQMIDVPLYKSAQRLLARAAD